MYIGCCKICLIILLSILNQTILRASSIEGRVLDGRTGKPLVGANIIIDENNRGTASDRNGYFKIERLTDGTYTLRVQYVGYATVTKTILLPAAPFMEIELEERILEIDEVLVTTSPLGNAVGYQPAQSLSGELLQRRTATSIGEMLENTPGLAMRSFGSAPARPVIRGLDGDRVLVLENSERMGDLAETAADHAIALDPLSVDKIEVVRGPASLLYGSSALGGVINVFNEDIPRYWTHGTSGTLAFHGASMNKTGAGFARFLYGGEHWVSTGRISYRSAGNIRTPEGSLPGTFLRNFTSGAGAGYSNDMIHGGLTFGYLNKVYGLPDAIDAPSEDVEIRMERSSTQGRLHHKLSGFLHDVELRLGGARYAHREIQILRDQEGVKDEFVGLRFTQSTLTSTITTRHRGGGSLPEGMLGLNFLHRSLKVGGEEALTPDARSTTAAAFIYEEMPVRENIIFQAGGRIETHSISAVSNERFPDAGEERTTTTFSGSFGINYRPADLLELGFQLARAHRTPSVEELFSDSPHLGTGAYEIGDPTLRNETGFGVDLLARFSTRAFQAEIAGFMNRIDHYIFLRSIGEIHEPSGLPVYVYESDNVLLAGGEITLKGSPTDYLNVETHVSYVRGSRRDAAKTHLPFMPPLRGFLSVMYDSPSWWIGGTVDRANAQTRVDENEKTTDGYVLLGLEGGYRLQASGRHVISLRIDNILDTTYRDHLSRVEDRNNPMPGRNVNAAYRWYF
jgi:iron complex outermembrane recepter protein